MSENKPFGFRFQELKKRQPDPIQDPEQGQSNPAERSEHHKTGKRIGRPPKTEEEKKTERLEVYCTKEEARLFREYCRTRGYEPYALLRKEILEAVYGEE